MKSAIRAIPILAVASLLGGCALFGIETGYRSLTIKNHRFDQTRVVVPKDRPFMLTIDGLDDRDLAISAPELGIDVLRVPATPDDRSPLVQTRPHPAQRALLPLGPLKAGRYPITCECHGHPSEAVIVAE
ncbi:MAG: hypothetical protein J0H99_14140 [Rhodospirillales bacterium]|nr:hypothetical protein [Rhodospirillales bacterium]